MRYSLANHILSIKCNDDALAPIGVVSIGGEGSYLSSIEISTSANLWEVNSYATGGYVHNKNLDRSGTVSVSLNQLSDAVRKLKRYVSYYYAGDYDGFTLTLTTNEGDLIATCTDCFIQKVPGQSFGSSAANQTWSFVCGKIVYNV